MSETEWGVVLVASTSHALRGEKVLTQAGLSVKLIPTPRQLSSECGVVLRFKWTDQERIEQALCAQHVPFERIVALE